MSLGGRHQWAVSRVSQVAREQQNWAQLAPLWMGWRQAKLRFDPEQQLAGLCLLRCWGGGR